MRFACQYSTEHCCTPYSEGWCFLEQNRLEPGSHRQDWIVRLQARLAGLFSFESR